MAPFGSVLRIRGFRIYNFAYSLKCICSPRISTHSAFTVIRGHAQNAEKFKSPDTRSQLRLNKETLCLPVAALLLCPFTRLCSAMFFALVFSVGEFAVKMTPNYSAEVLPGVPKHETAAMCLTEKIHVLHKLIRA